MIQDIINDINEKMVEVYNNIDPKTKNFYHTRLQESLVSLSRKYDLHGEPEYRVYLSDGTKGKTDVVWVDVASSPIVAIEMDSAIREKSILKLLELSCKFKILIYYGKHDEELLNVLKELDKNRDIFFVHKSLKLGKNKDYGITKEFYRNK